MPFIVGLSLTFVFYVGLRSEHGFFETIVVSLFFLRALWFSYN
jgi:hypothetical protein